MLVKLLAAAIAGSVPASITIFRLWGMNRFMDEIAHLMAGISLTLFATFLTGELASLAIAVALGLAWEWVEPRLPWDLHTGDWDTFTDMVLVILGGSIAVLALLVS